MTCGAVESWRGNNICCWSRILTVMNARCGRAVTMTAGPACRCTSPGCIQLTPVRSRDIATFHIDATFASIPCVFVIRFLRRSVFQRRMWLAMNLLPRTETQRRKLIALDGVIYYDNGLQISLATDADDS